MATIQDRIVDFFQTKPNLVYSVIRQVDGIHPKDYDDLFQEVWIKTYFAAHTYNYEKSPTLTSWIYTIVRNFSYDWSKRRKNQTLPSLEELHEKGYEPAGEDPFSYLDQIEEIDLIFKIVLNRIPVKYRQIIRDKFVKQLDYGQIQAKYGIARSTARWRLHQSMQLLKQEWVAYNNILQTHGTVECLCGCGTELPKVVRGKELPARFARGHYKKVDARKYSEETTSCACGCGRIIYKYSKDGTLRQFYKTHGSQKEGSPTKRKYDGATREIRMLQSILTNRQLYKKRALKAGIVPAKLIEKNCTKCGQQKLCKFSGQFRADGSPRYNPWCIDCLKDYGRVKRKLYRDRKKDQTSCIKKASTNLSNTG